MLLRERELFKSVSCRFSVFVIHEHVGFCRSCSVTIYEFFYFVIYFFVFLCYLKRLKLLGVFQLKITDITCMSLTGFVGSVFNM